MATATSWPIPRPRRMLVISHWSLAVLPQLPGLSNIARGRTGLRTKKVNAIQLMTNN
jgi:hypothetical protein